MALDQSPWSTPESNLDAPDFCRTCLLDKNPPGEEKIKARCYFPVQKRPGAAVSARGLANAAARLPRAKISPEDRRSVARKIVRLRRQNGLPVSETLLRMAGMR